MTSRALMIATAHVPISADGGENGRSIRALMRDARASGAHLGHFPEGAASGYAKSEIKNPADVDWPSLARELEETASLAKALGLWVVLGSLHRLNAPHRPHNSLYVISDAGVLVGRYDKRFLSNTEVNDWFTPGFEPLISTINDLRFGCALCIEGRFPEVFGDYNEADAHAVLLSSYSNDPMDELLACAHAAVNNFWVSFSVPSTPKRPLASALIGPDGKVLVRARAGTPSI